MRTWLISALAAGLAVGSLAAADAPANVAGYVQCDSLSASSANLETQVLAPEVPTTSALNGHGCGSPDGISFAGELEAGVVDAITVSLDWLGAGAERAGQSFDLTGTVEIDGVSFDVAVTAPTVPTNDAGFGPVTYDVEFTLTGLAAELPESSGTRSIAVDLSVPGTNGVPWAGPGMWVWGASEVPAGVILHEVAPS